MWTFQLYIVINWLPHETSQLSRLGSNQRCGGATAHCRGVSERENTWREDRASPYARLEQHWISKSVPHVSFKDLLPGVVRFHRFLLFTVGYNDNINLFSPPRPNGSWGCPGTGTHQITGWQMWTLYEKCIFVFNWDFNFAPQEVQEQLQDARKLNAEANRRKVLEKSLFRVQTECIFGNVWHPATCIPKDLFKPMAKGHPYWSSSHSYQTWKTGNSRCIYTRRWDCRNQSSEKCEKNATLVRHLSRLNSGACYVVPYDGLVNTGAYIARKWIFDMFGSILHPANFTISVCKMDGYSPKQNLAQGLETKTGNQRSWATRRPFSGFATVAGWRGDGARHHRRSYWWFLWWWGSMDTDEQVWHQIFFPPNHKGDTAAFFCYSKD